MELYNKKSDCYGCGSCSAICPVEAISMEADAEGFLYPVICADQCIECGMCEEVCSKIHMPEGIEGQFYAVRSKDENLLRKSTSGGAFSLIAEEILKEDGLVCGVCLGTGFQVIHKLSNDICAMRKAKYVQSDMRHIYEELKKALESGKKILFSGTPCQCQAVKEYFSAYKEQLLFVALICRGVQSPKLWEEYIAYLGKENPVTYYDFRDKSYCDDAHTIAYCLGEEKYLKAMNKDRFSRLYIKCLTLRPSCYQCEFCRTDLQFDFTIGDFWGIEKIHPELADGKGTSLVIVRTEQAKKIMENMEKKAVVIPCEAQAGEQPALHTPAKETILRKLLFKDLANIGSDGHCDMELILKKYGA